MRHLAAILALATALVVVGVTTTVTVAAPARVVPTALPFAPAWTHEYQGTPPVAAALSDGGWLVAGFTDHLEFISLATGVLSGSLPLPATRLECDRAVCVVADDTTIRAIDIATRTVRWQKPFAGALAFPPALRSGWIFLTGKDGRVTALRDNDGTDVWKFSARAPLTGPASIDGDRIAIATADAAVTLLDLRTGRALWTTPIETGMPGTPRLGGGDVYVGTEDRDLVILNAANGRVTALQRTGAKIVGAPALDEHLIYTVGQDGVIRAFERGNGALKWYNDLPTRPASIGPVTSPGLVTVALRDGSFQVMLGDGDGKKPAALIAPPGPVDNPPTLPVAPMAAGTGPALRLATISVAVGDTSKWSATVTAAAAGLPVSTQLPALIPGLALQLTAPRAAR